MTPTKILSISIGFVLILMYIISDIQLLKFNPTPSLPQGIYIRTFQKPHVGSIVWFRAPAELIDFLHISYPAATAWFSKPYNGLLKVVVAHPGDKICQDNDGFRVNNETLSIKDNPVGKWIGCYVLANDQIAVFADGVDDSFDSRMYGPININEAKTYTQLARW